MFDPPGDTVPPLGRDGLCRRAALDPLAEGLPFSQLVEMLVRDHGARFRTHDDARRYRGDMVARYCERPERSADRAQQRAIEGRMSLGDVGRVGHGDAANLHPGVGERPCAEADSGSHPDHGTSTAQRQDQPDQLRSSDARRAPQTNHSGDAINGAPNAARVTGDPGERKAPNRATTANVRRVDRRLARCRRGSVGRATAATTTTPGERRRSATSTSARVTTTLTVQPALPADVEAFSSRAVSVWHDVAIVSPATPDHHENR